MFGLLVMVSPLSSVCRVGRGYQCSTTTKEIKDRVRVRGCSESCSKLYLSAYRNPTVLLVVRDADVCPRVRSESDARTHQPMDDIDARTHQLIGVGIPCRCCPLIYSCSMVSLFHEQDSPILKGANDERSHVTLRRKQSRGS